MTDEQQYTLFWIGFVLLAMFFLVTKNWHVLFSMFLLDWVIRHQWKYLPKGMKQ